jgi:glycosyltransferase involved in cell wall biosynthesis
MGECDKACLVSFWADHLKINIGLRVFPMFRKAGNGIIKSTGKGTRMDQKHRVSIGLPVYNAEKYLEQALDSLLAQTFENFVLVISDNASTDHTQSICQAYQKKDPRIQYYRNEKNLGIAPNFRRAFQLSSSEYFKWAPYDDLIAPDFLARCVAVLDQNPDVILVYSKVKIIDENGAYVVDYDPGPETNLQQPNGRFRNLMLHPEYAVQQMGLMRSGVLKNTGLIGSYPCSDEILLAELSLLGQFYEIPERLYYYRRHGEQSTQGAYMLQRSRVVLFDTSYAGKIVLPKWVYFFASLKAIAQAPVNASERLLCYGHMLRWLLIPPNFRAMGKDLLLAAKQIIGGKEINQSMG